MPHAPVINFALIDLGSPHNIGLIIRTCWVLAGENAHLYVYDPRNKLTLNRDDIDLTSGGLISRKEIYTRIDDLNGFLSAYLGRIIATEVSGDATPLTEFSFQQDDLILFGNENRGYRDKELRVFSGIERVTKHLIVPMQGETYVLPDRGEVVPQEFGQYPNLNVAISAAIVGYIALEQIGRFKGFDLENTLRRTNL